MNFKKDVLECLGHELTEAQLQQFNMYFSKLIEYNKHTNLTRITKEVDVYYKHFFDSIALIKYLDLSRVNSICDMGSGAGFPSLPLKILFPNLEVTIVDSLNKRITFLSELVAELNLSHVRLVHDRVEIFAKTRMNAFDLVTARALGDLSLILEMGLPMAKIGSKFVAYKGHDYQEELVSSKKAIDRLGGKINSVYSFDLPHAFGARSFIIIDKVKLTEGYPRSFQMMKKNPL